MRLGFDNGGERELVRFDDLLASVERAVRDLRSEAFENEAARFRLQW